MTRLELVEAVATKAQISTQEADKIVRIFIDTIQENIASGQKITLSGFGTFERRMRKATMARNPQTGEPMPVEAQNVATFRAGSALKEAVKRASIKETISL